MMKRVCFICLVLADYIYFFMFIYPEYEERGIYWQFIRVGIYGRAD